MNNLTTNQRTLNTVSDLFHILGIAAYAVLIEHGQEPNPAEIRGQWLGEELSTSQASLQASVIAADLWKFPSIDKVITKPYVSGKLRKKNLATCAGLEKNNNVLLTLLLLATLDEDPLRFSMLIIPNTPEKEKLARVHNGRYNSESDDRHFVVHAIDNPCKRPNYPQDSTIYINLVSEREYDVARIAMQSTASYDILNGAKNNYPYGVIYTEEQGKEIHITFSLR